MANEIVTQPHVHEDWDECIANTLWCDCDSFLVCKTNDLEIVAQMILHRLRANGYDIVESDDCGQ